MLSLFSKKEYSVKKVAVKLKDINVKSFLTTIPMGQVRGGGGDQLEEPATYVQCTGGGCP